MGKYLKMIINAFKMPVNKIPKDSAGREKAMIKRIIMRQALK